MAGPSLRRVHVRHVMANCLIVQHVVPEPSWAIGAALARAGIGTEVRRFDLPPGGTRLAQNARDANQAFRVGEAAWGLQFHLEVTPGAVEGFLDAFPTDVARAPGGGRISARFRRYF
jgi:hypothetical protein